MNAIVPISQTSEPPPALVTAAGERASMRFLEFFAANIRNPHTGRAYARAADEFLAWCADAGVQAIAAVQPVHRRHLDRSVDARALGAQLRARCSTASIRPARSLDDRADGLFVRPDRRALGVIRDGEMRVQPGEVSHDL
jgi:hypothetical protein